MRRREMVGKDLGKDCEREGETTTRSEARGEDDGGGG
jgi:hypothetical protein